MRRLEFSPTDGHPVRNETTDSRTYVKDRPMNTETFYSTFAIATGAILGWAYLVTTMANSLLTPVLA